jgi:outer membrane protein assembly factor BamB
MLELYFCVMALAADAKWTGFLGAETSHVSPDSIPTEWSPEKNIAWKAALPGHGQSSPVIWGDKVFVTAIEGPNKEQNHVLCLSLKDGSELWRKTTESSMPVKNSVYVSRAAPTPCVDENGVYAFFESGDVIAYDHHGKQLWAQSLGKDYGKIESEFGIAASPVQLKDRIIIAVDFAGPSYLVALDKQDGQEKWKTSRTSRTSWSSPYLLHTQHGTQVILSSAGSVDGYDPMHGKQLWTIDGLGGNTAATPVPNQDGIFLVAASAGREGNNENAKNSNFAMRVFSSADGTWNPEVMWRTKDASPSFASSIIYKDCAYWINRSGVVYCYDLGLGKEHYTKRVAQSSWATPVGLGNHVYFFGKDGITTVIKAGAEFSVVSENQLWNPDEGKADPAAAAAEESEERKRSAAMFGGRTQYGVAVVDGSLLIRTGDILYCVRGQ